MCFYGAWTSKSSLQMQQALQTKRPNTTTINMEELWLNLAPLPDAKGKGGNHSPAAGPSISFLYLRSLPIKCYEFKIGRCLSSRKGSGVCPLDSNLLSFSGKKKTADTGQPWIVTPWFWQIKKTLRNFSLVLCFLTVDVVWIWCGRPPQIPAVLTSPSWWAMPLNWEAK